MTISYNKASLTAVLLLKGFSGDLILGSTLPGGDGVLFWGSVMLLLALYIKVWSSQ